MLSIYQAITSMSNNNKNAIQLFDFPRAARTYEIIDDILKSKMADNFDHKESPFIIYPKQLQNHPISTAYSRLEGISVFSGTLNHHPFDSIIIDGNQEVFKFQSNDQSYFGNSPKYCRNLNVDKILELSKSALFGQGSHTIFDESVRKGKEIPADRITLKYNSLINNLWSQLTKLAPEGKQLRPKLYKMHIYEKGGLFQKHRDTLHAVNHFATLIIGVSWDFKGGQLQITDSKSGDKVHCIQFDLKSRAYSYNNYEVKYAVFVTDAVHEVTEVTEGVRIVLQYDLYLEDNTEYKDYVSDPEEDDYFEEKPYIAKNRKSKLEIEKTSEIMKQLDFEIEQFQTKNPDTVMYFLLNHAYPIGMTIDLLKDKDRQLYDLLSKKYTVFIGACFHRYVTDHEAEVSLEDKRDLCVLGITGQKAAQHYIETGVKPFFPVKENAVIFFPVSVDFNCKISQEAVEHTGNEAAPGYYAYQSMVLGIAGSQKINQ